MDRLKDFGSVVRSDYPHSSTRDLIQAALQFDAGQSAASSSRKVIGYIFHSSDRKQAVQARLDGFTFSRFAPYQNWETLKAEALRVWKIFVPAISPRRITRIGLRYVNQINLPLRDGTLTFEHYLRTFPKMGDEDGPTELIEQLFMRLVLPQVDLQGYLILTESFAPPQPPLPYTSIGVILDLDLFRDHCSFEVQSNEIWDILDRFRERKNRYFESSITDAARELFK